MKMQFRVISRTLLILAFVVSAMVVLGGCGGGGHTHDFTVQKAEENYLKSAADCKNPTSYYYSCECGEKGSESFTSGSPLGHTEIVDAGKAPTCTEAGLTDGKRCAVCNEVVLAKTEIAPLKHDYINHAAKDPTCTEVGWNTYDTCSRCDFTSFSVIPIAHTLKDAVVENIVEAGCTEAGSYDSVVYCDVCDAEISREEKSVDPLDHAYINHEAKAETCLESGWAAYDTCSRCDYTTYSSISALGHNFFDGKCTRCGEAEKKEYVREGDYIYFGEYPQTLKANDVTITSTTDSRGYYLGSDGCYYAKITATPFSNGYTSYSFSSGEKVTGGTVYYFKVEPIKWRILEEKNGEIFLLCDGIIDNHIYDKEYNNYENSYIREWLNDTFYKTAFDSLQQQIIATTIVDNGAESTGFLNNPYVCPNTLDKVFLLSSKELQDLVSDRGMKISDFALAVGSYIYAGEYPGDSSWYGNGDWFLRSPYYENSAYVQMVAHNLSLLYDNAFAEPTGVVPALKIQIHAPTPAVEENKKDYTCKENGSYDSVVYCGDCGAEISIGDVILYSPGHMYAQPVEENKVEPTCTENGFCDYAAHCSVCEELVSKETVILGKNIAEIRTYTFFASTALKSIVIPDSVISIGNGAFIRKIRV